jgi:hypothetical protein
MIGGNMKVVVKLKGLLKEKFSELLSEEGKKKLDMDSLEFEVKQLVHEDDTLTIDPDIFRIITKRKEDGN